MFISNSIRSFLINAVVNFIIIFLDHGHGFVSVKWFNGQESFATEGEVLDACKVSDISFASEDLNEHVILESSTHRPYTTSTKYLDLHDFGGDFANIFEYVVQVITTYCKVNVTVPPDQNIILTILESSNNDVPSYLYVEKDCTNSSCIDK